MMTSKQEWFILKLKRELEAIDSEKYDTAWMMNNIFYMDAGFKCTTKREASEDIQRLLAELEQYK